MQIQHWPGLTPYQEALERQQSAVEALLNGTGPEIAFFLEHPPMFTTGSSAQASEILNPGPIPIIPTGRGGKTTYHGPGQRVVYLITDLRQSKDLRAYIKSLQNWLISSLADLNIEAFTTDDIGIWVNQPNTEYRTPNTEPAKLAAIGIRVRKWVAFHGIALNVNPDLSAYQRIIPCGLSKPVTSMAALGQPYSLADVDTALIKRLQL